MVIKCPKKPKSTRDINGINQGEVWEHITSENPQTSTIKLVIIIKNLSLSPTGEIMIHRTSKIILKKRKIL